MSYLAELRTRYPALDQYSDEEIIPFLPQIAPNKFGGLQGQDLVYAATTDDSQFTKGIKSGVDQVQALGGGLLALSGDYAGADSVKEKGLEIYQSNMDEAAKYRPDSTFTEIEGVGDALDWAGYTLGNLAPTMATAAAGGGVGGIVGKKAAQTAAANLIKSELAKGVSKEVAIKSAGELIAKRIATGQGLGAYVASAGMETGSIYGETEDANVSALHGAVAGAFDALPVARVLGKFGLAGAAKKEITGNVVNRIAKEGLKQSAFEGGTEGLQTLVEQHAKFWVDNNGASLLQNLGDVGWNEVIEATAAGALGGFAMGGPTGALSRPGDQNKLSEAGKKTVDEEILKQTTENISQADNIDDAIDAATRGVNAVTPDTQTAQDLGVSFPENSYLQDQIDIENVKAGATPDQRHTASMEGIDGLIITARRLGFADEEAKLTTAKRLYSQYKQALDEGNGQLADRFLEQGNKLYRDATGETGLGQPETKSYVDQFPVPYVYQGELSGGQLTPSNSPNFTMQEPDIEGAATRLDVGDRLLEDQGKRIGSESMIYGQKPPRDFTPVPPNDSGVGQNIVNRMQTNPNRIEARPGYQGRQVSNTQISTINRTPVTTWSGSQGDGFKTENGAKLARIGRERAQPELQWTVEQRPDGRFEVAGYDLAQSTDFSSNVQDSEQFLNNERHQSVDEGQTQPWAIKKSVLESNFQIQPKSNNTELQEYSYPEQGAMRVDPVTNEVSVFQMIPLSELRSSEQMDDVAKGREDTQKYIQWAKEGRNMPPVDVVRTDKGNLVSTNRRRLYAAQQAGLQFIPAWVDVEGSLKHRDIVQNAINEGKSVPNEVLAEYPEISSKQGQEPISEAKTPPQGTFSAPTEGLGANQSNLQQESTPIGSQAIPGLSQEESAQVAERASTLTPDKFAGWARGRFGNSTDKQRAAMAFVSNKGQSIDTPQERVEEDGNDRQEGYVLPEKGEWNGNKSQKFSPTERQQRVMDAVAAALDDGKFYTTDVVEYVAQKLQVSPETRKIGATRVEHGDFGMDVYNARLAVEAQRQRAKEDATKKELGNFVRVGAKLGTITPNDGKQLRGAYIEGVSDGGEFFVVGTRGKNRLRFTLSPTGLKRAIDRGNPQLAEQIQASVQQSAQSINNERPESVAQPDIKPGAELTAREKALVEQKKQADRRAKRNRINTDKDSIGVAVSKYGGISFDYMEDMGFEGNVNLGGGHWLFKKGGTSPDDMAMKLAQDGYLPQPEMESKADNGGVNRLYEILSGDGGKNWYIPGTDAANLQQLKAEQEELEARLAQEEADFEQEIAYIESEYGEIAAAKAREYDEMTRTIGDKIDRENDRYEQIARERTEFQDYEEAAALGILDENERASEREQAETAGDSQEDGFELSQETEESRQQREHNDQEAKDRARKLREREKRQQQREDDARATRQAVDESVNRFELGQDVDQQLSGQDDLLSRPVSDIDDFGEKLGGAKKDLANSLRKEVSDDDYKSLPLSKLWPKKELESIDDPFIAAFASAARSEIPAKPRKAWRVEQWAGKVKSFRELLTEVLEAKDPSFILDEIEKSGSRTLKDFAAKVKLLQGIDRAQWDRIGQVQEAPNAGRYQGEEFIKTPSVYVSVDGRSVRFDGKSIADVLDAVNESLSSKAKPEGGGIQFDIRGYKNKNMWFLVKKGDSEYRPLKTFTGTDALEKARDFKKNNYDDLVNEWEAVKERDNVGKSDVRNKENRPRTGKDYRKGQDITPEMFSDTFGFRGVEFGNWVKQGKNAKERQGMLNQAYDALMDLAEILDIPPKAVSLDGSLGVGFGSRGSGKASAHYEPGNVVINLTKTRGAGSLAHEWFHALDNYFSRKRGVKEFTGDNQSYREGNYITYRPEPMMVRKDRMSYVGAMTKADLQRRHEEHPSSGLYNPEMWEIDPNHPNGVRPEVERAFAELVEKLNESPMKGRSATIDKGKANGYWSQIIERGARSFESYIVTKMHQEGYDNDYLANIKEFGDWTKNPERYPYLKPDEIAPIEKAFDTLFDTIESRETDSGVELYSQGTSTSRNLTRDTLASEIDKAFGKNFTQALEKSGLFKMVSRDEVPEVIEDVKYSETGSILGFVKNGVAHLVYDNIGKGDSIKGLVNHEVGVHVMRLGRDSKEFQSILKQVEFMRKGNEKVKAAFRRVPKDTKPENVTEEALSYLIEDNSDISVVKKFLAWFREQIRNLGKTIKGAERFAFVKWANSLNENDLVRMATKATRRAVNGSENPSSRDIKRSMADNERGDRSTSTPTPERSAAEDIKEKILSLDGEYNHFGIRVLPDSQSHLEPGDEIDPSYVWEDGNWTDEQLDGTSASEVDAESVDYVLLDIGAAGRYNKSFSGYRGKKVALIAGNNISYGNDPGEIVISDPNIIAVYEKESDTVGAGGGLLPVNPNPSPRTEGADILYSRSEGESVYDKLYESLGNKDKTILDRAKTALKRELTPGGLLPETVFKAKLDRDFKLNGMEFDIANRLGHFETAVKKVYGKNFNTLSDEEKAKINNALGGEADTTLDPAIREELYKMRIVIKGLSQEYAAHLESEIAELREAGDPAAESKAQLLETINNNLDTYVHRSYRAFDDKDWPRKVSREVVDNAIAYLENQYAGDGEVTPAIEKKVSQIVELMLEEGTAFDSMEAFIKESKLGAKDLSVLQRRKQIAPEIRALLGEYTDPKINFTKSVTKMSRLVMNQKFLDRVKEIGLAEGGFLFTEENRPLDATRKIAADASESYSPLNGYYTYPEVEQAFRDALGKEQMADWFRTIVRINGMVKYGKTVLSPTTAFRNWMSAAFFSMANGHFNFAQMKKSTESIREYFTHGEGKDGYLRKLKELGVIYDTPYAGEMMDLLADSQLESSLYDKKPFTGIRKANDFAQKFYQYGDDFWKIMGFENEKTLLMKHQDMTEAQAEVEAAERIRNTYPTYSMTSRFVQRLRRFPLAGTFVSFPSEIVRTTYHILRYLKQDMKSHPAYARRKIAGLVVASGMIHALQSISMAMMGMDDDDEEAFRDLAPPWQKNSNLLALGRDEKGNIRIIDLSFLDPYNYWKRPINAIMRDAPYDEELKTAASDILSPFFGQDIAFGAIMEAINNKKDSGGRVFNPHAPAADQTIDIINHLRKSLQPGIASNLERITKAASGEVSASGRPYTLPDEMAALAGFRATTFDPKSSIYYRAFEFQDKKRDATSILSSVARNPNKVSDNRLIKSYKQAEETRFEAYEEMIRLVNAAINAGLSKQEIARALRNSGVSKQDTFALINGRVPTWKPSDAMMRNAVKKAQVLFDDDVAQEFQRRQKLIQEQFREGLKR